MDASVAGQQDEPRLVADAAGRTSLETQLDELARLDLHELRVRWRKLLRTSPPQLPRPVLLRVLAYRLQARAWGDLDRETVRYLDRIARESARRRRAGEEKRNPKAPPPIPPVPTPSKLKPGTLLAREFNGRMHRVTVTPDGFAWQGSTYKSLSEVARLITGTRWNGPRFFGLRDKIDGGRTPGEIR
jgi:hypothetical protein